MQSPSSAHAVSHVAGTHVHTAAACACGSSSQSKQQRLAARASGCSFSCKQKQLLAATISSSKDDAARTAAAARFWRLASLHCSRQAGAQPAAGCNLGMYMSYPFWRLCIVLQVAVQAGPSRSSVRCNRRDRQSAWGPLKLLSADGQVSPWWQEVWSVMMLLKSSSCPKSLMGTGREAWKGWQAPAVMTIVT